MYVRLLIIRFPRSLPFKCITDSRPTPFAHQEYYAHSTFEQTQRDLSRGTLPRGCLDRHVIASFRIAS